MEGGASAPVADDGGATASSAAPSSSSSSSVEALLSVPLDLILRELPTPHASAPAATATGAPRRKTRRRTLLSRSEATALLRVTQLSIEQDVLVGLAADVLANAHMCATLRRRIEDSCRVLHGGTSNGGDSSSGGSASEIAEIVPPVRYPRHLLALLPILSVHADSIPDRTVRHVQAESQRILTELAQCATTLRQCAEHNWTVSEHLLVDVGGAVGGGVGGTTTGSNVGRDKESLAEIEEAVCDRIEGLIGMAVDTGSTSNRGDSDDDVNIKSPAGSRKRKRGAEDASGAIPQDVFDVSVDYTSGEFVSMAELCGRLFPDLRDGITQEAKVKVGGGTGENTTSSSNTAGVEETAKKQTGESSSGAEPMDVDNSSLADAGTTLSVTKEVGGNGDTCNQASGSFTASNIDAGKMESSGAKSKSNDDEDNDSDNGSETKEKALHASETDDDDEDEDLPRDASSSSSPSQSQVNAAAALAVLAST